MGKSVINGFLDMFLGSCQPGEHGFIASFGDGRREFHASVTRSSTVWPYTFMDGSFPQFVRMLDAWLAGSQDAFLTVRSVLDEHGRVFPVEEVRCWSLTHLGALPLSGEVTALQNGAGESSTVWDLDRERQVRFVDAWDLELTHLAKV